MRIVGGEARGRSLRAVPGDGTRPTADRVRQSLFDWLGQRCDGLAVLDLYAGTGALSFEALSRGAVRAVLIERERAAVEVIQENARALKMEQRCRIVRDDVVRALEQLGARGERFELVFSDPPYALHAAQETLERLARLELVAQGGRVVLERGRREPAPRGAPGFVLLDERTYGDTVLTMFHRTLAPPAPSDNSDLPS